MNNFKRHQLKRLVEQLPEDGLEDALRALTEIMDRPRIVFNLQNPEHVKKLMELAGVPAQSPQKKKPL